MSTLRIRKVPCLKHRTVRIKLRSVPPQSQQITLPPTCDYCLQNKDIGMTEIKQLTCWKEKT